MRLYDAELGRFTSVDPLWEEHVGMTPYHYALSNPISWFDWNGLDTNQRVRAVEMARAYLGSGSTYIMGQKGGPGEPVDCSGLVSQCVVAGGERDPNRGRRSSGVLNIESTTSRKSIEDAQPGNIVTFRNEKPGAYPYHTGVITAVNRNADGKVETFQVVHSSSRANGPTMSSINPSSPNALGTRIRVEAVLRWDQRPDTPAQDNASEPEKDAVPVEDDGKAKP